MCPCSFAPTNSGANWSAKRTRNILRITGVLLVGEEASEIIRGSQRSAREHGLPIEVLSKRGNQSALSDPAGAGGGSGRIRAGRRCADPERAIEAQLNVAAARGAEMRFGVALQAGVPRPAASSILLADEHAHFRARSGPRARPLVQGCARSARHFHARAAQCPGLVLSAHRGIRRRRFPAFLSIARVCPRRSMAFLILATESKPPSMLSAISPTRSTSIARSTRARHRTARASDRTMDARRGRDLYVKRRPCMYSLTPDEHFVIDRHPDHPRIDPLRRLLRPRVQIRASRWRNRRRPRVGERVAPQNRFSFAGAVCAKITRRACDRSRVLEGNHDAAWEFAADRGSR